MVLGDWTQDIQNESHDKKHAYHSTIMSITVCHHLNYLDPFLEKKDPCPRHDTRARIQKQIRDQSLPQHMMSPIYLASVITWKQGVHSTREKDTMLFLGAKWARKSKSEVTLSSKCLVEKLWLLLCFVGKKINPQFLKNFLTALIILHTFQKNLWPLD